MNETLVTLVLLWVPVSLIWLMSLYNVMHDRKVAFFEYVQHHQHFIALYLDAARRNRKLIQQHQNFKFAVQDFVFYPGGYTLEQCEAFYKKYDIERKLYENESAEKEVNNLIKQDVNETRYNRTILS